MDRRRFLQSVALMAIAAPTAALPSLVAAAPAESFEVSPKILNLEAQLAVTAGFSWYLHNELRHEYLAYSERVSRAHADAILRHAPMDEYILNTLSDWHFTDWWGKVDAQKGIETLLENAARYTEFPALRAACLLRAGEAYAALGDATRANKLFALVSQMGLLNTNAPSLDIYRARARAKMGV
jgi:hypothetical protein